MPDASPVTSGAHWPRARVWWAVALGAWTALIARVTLVPQIGGTGRVYEFVAAVTGFLTGGHVVPTFLVVEGIGNVLMFVPFGFLLAAVVAYPLRGVGTARLLRAAAVAVVVSIGYTLLIEYVQGAMFPQRVSEVRDLLHNTLGGVLGAALAVAVGWRLGIARRRAYN